MNLLEKAAEARTPAPEALTLLGSVYETGGLTCPRTGKFHMLIKNQSLAKAEELYRDAAQMGCILAQNHLGKVAYEQGSFGKAADHFKNAAQENDKLGLFNLGTCYELGY